MNEPFIRRAGPLLALTILAIGGCGTTKSAKLLTWRSAEFNVAGVERLAVLGFRAPPHVSSIVEETALNDLQQTGFYSVVRDTQHVQYRAAHIPLPHEAGGLDQIMARGRQLGVDAVLVGRVRKRLNLGKEFGNVTVQLGSPKLDVMVQYYVVDVHARAIRAEKKITRSDSNEDLNIDEDLTKRLVENLVRECSVEMVAQITAGSQLTDVELARVNLGKGSGYIRDGNKLAGENKWKEAAEQYRAALEVNPQSHQAIYNLGLVAEAHGRFGEARQMYQSAAEKSDETLYRDAIARVDKNGQSFQLAQQQIHQRPRARFTPSRRVAHQHVRPPVPNPGRTHPPYAQGIPQPAAAGNLPRYESHERAGNR